MDSSINWTLSVLVAIPLSIAANLMTPAVRDHLASRSVTRAKKRLQELRAELDVHADFNIPNLIGFGFRSILKVLGLFLLGGIVGSFAEFVIILKPIEAVLYVMSFNSVAVSYRRLRPYDVVYLESVRLRIERIEESISRDNRKAP